MDPKKKFYAIPENISKMTDEEIEVWTKSLYKKIVQEIKQRPSK